MRPASPAMSLEKRSNSVRLPRYDPSPFSDFAAARFARQPPAKPAARDGRHAAAGSAIAACAPGEPAPVSACGPARALAPVSAGEPEPERDRPAGSWAFGQLQAAGDAPRYGARQHADDRHRWFLHGQLAVMLHDMIHTLRSHYAACCLLVALADCIDRVRRSLLDALWRVARSSDRAVASLSPPSRGTQPRSADPK
jgi:hypothetical protein